MLDLYKNGGSVVKKIVRSHGSENSIFLRKLQTRPKSRKIKCTRDDLSPSRESESSIIQVSPPPQRIFAVSDIHVDYEANLKWAKAIDSSSHRNDVLLIAGDVCDDIFLLLETLKLFTERFRRVFYCIGNHELWIRAADKARGMDTSVQKLRRILFECECLGVGIAPERLGNVWIAPLHSWHHASFDTEPDIRGVPAASPLTIVDYAACEWTGEVPGGDTPGSESLAKWFDAMNDGNAWDEMLATRMECDIVSFSHFLPRLELLPEKRFLFFPNLAKASGSLALKRRVEILAPDIHVFGHTHFGWDATLDGIRYIQAPLSSPIERQRRLRTVSFDAFMSKGVGVDGDFEPGAAAWLPLEIYRSRNYTEGQGEEEKLLSETESESGEECAACNGEERLFYLAASSAEDGDSELAIDPLTAASEAMHGMPFVLQGVDDDPLQDSISSEHTPEIAERDKVVSGSAKESLRQSALLHGTAPGNLGAHWSTYYDENPRTPEITTLSPWVARRYSKRRKRSEAEEGRGMD